MAKLKPADHARLDIATKLVLGGRNPDEQFGFVNTPIYRGSTVLKATVQELNSRHEARFVYGTVGTPTTEALERPGRSFPARNARCWFLPGLRR